MAYTYTGTLNAAATGNEHGVNATSTGAKQAIFATSSSANAILAQFTGTAIQSAMGAINQSTGIGGVGLWGSANSASANGIGVYGEANGVYGSGLKGASSHNTGTGVYGVHSASGSGVSGSSASGTGVYGEASSGLVAGVSGHNTGAGFLEATGVAATTMSAEGYGLYCKNFGTNGIALKADGQTRLNGETVTYGDLSTFYGDIICYSGTKYFIVDHPLDPENKEIAHACIEAPVRRNVYDGVGVADFQGELVVQLPSYFEALNEDHGFFLTPIGNAAPALHVKHEVKNNKFVIAGALPGQRVAWMVTGTRKDPAAKAKPMIAERDKRPDARGRYHAPGAYGQPETNATAYMPPVRLAAPTIV